MTKRELLTKDQKAQARKKSKNDTTADNCRNRLLEAFGEDAVSNADGELYSQAQDQEGLFLRAFERVRDGELDVRHRVVTVGLRAVLLECPEKPDIMLKLSELTEYFSKLRVYASLFSQFAVLRALESSPQHLPVIDSMFFRRCFDIFCYPRAAANPLYERFQEFTALTGISEFPAPQHVKEIKNDQASKLWTATKTRMQEHYPNRVKAIVSWVLRAAVSRHHEDMPRKTLTNKIHIMVTFICKGRQQSAADVVAKLIDLGFSHGAYRSAVILLNESAVQKDNVTDQIRHWYALQKTYVDVDRRRYESNVRAANKLYPRKADKDARQNFIRHHFKGKAPPKITAPLSFANPRAAFIRLDKATMRSLFPSLDIITGPWGYRAFLAPYGKTPNIRCLRCCTWGQSEMSMMAAIANPDVTECPWLVAPTFETDGHQMKLLHMTSHTSNPGPPGLRYLHEAGYKLRTRGVPVEEILERGRGVYNDSGLRYGERSSVDDVLMMGIDPGIIKPIAAICARGGDWDPIAALDPDASQNGFTFVTVTERDIKEMIGHVKNNKQESLARKRNQPYGAALRALWRHRKRTSDTTELVSYCRAWKDTEEAYWSEILLKARKVRRFERFRAVQAQAQRIKKKILQGFQREEAMAMGREGDITTAPEEGGRVIVFGNGSFKAKKGHVAVPRKQVIRACACDCCVVIADERGSSKYCPGCGEELVNVNDGDGRRVRVCQNPRCSLDTFDRDDGGVAGIMKTFLSRFAVRGMRTRRVRHDTMTDDDSTDDDT